MHFRRKDRGTATGAGMRMMRLGSKRLCKGSSLKDVNKGRKSSKVEH